MNLQTCTPSEDSDQPVHSWMCTLISLHRAYIKVSFLMLQLRYLIHITKTCLYNFDPLKPHFYIVKLGFIGITLFFLFLLKNIDCGYSLEPPRWGGSNEYPLSMFWTEIWKISVFYLKFMSFWRWNFLYFWIGVFS